ncbi:MAG: hypothetical protein ACYDDO_09720 [Acidiferrobacterales bacterium]
MSEDFGRCPLCGGEKQPGTTIFTVDLKFGVGGSQESPPIRLHAVWRCVDRRSGGGEARKHRCGRASQTRRDGG